MKQFFHCHIIHLSNVKNTVLLGIVTLLIISATTYGQFSHQQDASVVLGQSTFTTDIPGVTKSAMRYPQSIVLDSTTGSLFVSDNNNH